MIAAILVVALPLGAFAQQPTQGTTLTEIPARLRHLEGTVTVQRAAAGETEEAVMNLPLGSGDRIWSSESGRVEIMFEDGTSIWMSAATTLDFVSLPRPDGLSGAIVRLWTGSVFVQRPAPQAGTLLPLRMDSPAGAVTFDQPGLFRVDLDEDGRVWLSAYDGSAALDAGGLSERVYAGQQTLAEPGSAPAQAAAFNTSEADEFSSWRDERMALFASTQQYVRERDYVPSNIAYYAADLEPYGNWSYHPTYAAWYWRPRGAVAWSPYRHGRWAYTYAGWSWVPSTPWGYVTTHYGRWQHGSGGWMWFPGRVWSPASVHWYIGSGHVGWVPLNYYGRPAVSFGVHIGGGVSIGVSFGGYYDGYYGGHYGGYYGYPYYGYGYPYWDYPRRYRCCDYGYGGRFAYGGRGRPDQLTGRRGQGNRVGPIGSASGTGRVVKGRGYSSGLADAWTVVPSAEFSSRNVGRVAVARSALPRGLDQGSKAQITGTLRARRPSTLVPSPRRAAPTTTSQSGRRAVPSTGTNTPVRTTTSGARRQTTGVSTGASRAVPTRGQARRTVAPDEGRSTNSGRAVRSAPSVRDAPTPSTGVRRALRRNTGVAPRSTPPSVSGAVRQALSRRNTPTSVGAPRFASPPTLRSRGTVRSPSPRVRSATPSRSAPARRSSGSVRSAPSSPRSSGSVRSAPSSRRSSGSIRSAPAARPAPSARRRGSVGSAPRPGSGGGAVRAPARPGGGGARPRARAAKPRGGAPG
jgi:hypothetical protein